MTYQSPEDGFCVLRLKVRRHRRLITVVGHALPVRAGEFVQAAGTWVNDRTHGLQFRATLIRPTLPTTIDGIEAYLGSGLIKGIGPAYARRLVAAFGKGVFDVLERTPERLGEVAGIGARKARQIAAGWEERRAVQEIMTFLHAHGIGTAAAGRIFRAYGARAVQLISEDPYRLVREVRCVGFAAADAMAERLGIEKTAPVRARAAVAQVLAQAVEEGHCGLPRGHLVDLAVARLGVPRDAIEHALAEELAAGGVVADAPGGAEEAVFPAPLHEAQQAIAERLAALARGRPPWPSIDPAAAIPAVEGRIGLALSEGQRAAVRAALRSKLLVVTGGPGVGKSTLVEAILAVLRPLGVRVALAAPTGRAAKRLSETTGLEARTIHRLLEANPGSGGFRRNEENPLDCDLLVVDETSMVDVVLMSALLKAVPDHAALVLVGDVDQLPSVGPGQVLRDIIGAAAMPTVRLTEIFRQAARSRILLNAHRINRGEMPDTAPDPGSDFHFVPARDPEDMIRKILTIVRERIPRRFGLDPIREVQVLCPMNRGGLGAQSLNIELQKALNPNGGPDIERFGSGLRAGDKVMQVENDYDKEVYNGEVGIVAAIDRQHDEIRIEFDGRTVHYAADELEELALAYAITIHKSQGSEYPAVVIPLSMQHRRMLHRNLIYTGITRGRRLVVLVGQREALAAAVRTVQAGQRWSRLGDRLRRGGCADS